MSKNDKKKATPEKKIVVCISGLAGTGKSTLAKKIAKKYNKFLEDVEEIVLPPGDSEIKKPSYHLFEIKTKKRDELLKFLKENKIICLIHYPTPIPYQPIYKQLFGSKEGEFPKSEELSSQAMDLPLFPGLKDDQIKYISEKIHEFFKR